VLVQSLRVVLGLVFVLSVGSVVFEHEVGHDLAVAMVAVLAAAPVVRLLWLATRWTGKGDLRYAVEAGGLVCLIGAAAVIGLA
jgi:hypothetical protein